MKKALLAVIVALFCAGKASAQWTIGRGDYSQYDYSTGGGSKAPNLSLDRKIFQFSVEVRYGAHQYALFGLTNPGGTGRSADAIIIHDLSNPVQYELYKALLKIYELKQTIRYATNESRSVEAVSWKRYKNMYRVYAGDYFWYWAE